VWRNHRPLQRNYGRSGGHPASSGVLERGGVRHDAEQWPVLRQVLRGAIIARYSGVMDIAGGIRRLLARWDAAGQLPV